MKLAFVLSIIFGHVIAEISCFECMVFDIKHGHKVNGSFRTAVAASLQVCALRCLSEQRCQAANFDENGKNCELTDLILASAEMTPLDGWMLISKQVCHEALSSDVETFAETACGSKVVHECRHGYVSPGNQVSVETLSCSQLPSTNKEPKSCLPGTCKDILVDRPDAESKEYIYKDPNGNEVNVFCDFYGSYGYTFFSSASLSNLSSLETHYTTSSEAVIRHFWSDGSQTEATMKVITRYRNQYNLTFLLNEEFGSPNDSSSHEYTDVPYLTLGFVPSSFGNKKDTIQGYNVDGSDVEFTNCDTNPSNSIKFYLTPVIDTNGCCNSNIKSAWYDYASTNFVESGRHLPVEFSFKFMVCMGGCGAFWTYENFAMGVALGLKFSLEN